MLSRSKVEALRSFASKVRCASREIYKGAEAAEGAKGFIYIFPFGLVGPLGPFNAVVAWNKRNISLQGSTP